MLHSAHPLQNEQQQSRIWNLKAKNGFFYKHASASDFLTGSHSKCISDSFCFLAAWFFTVSLPPPHLSLLTLISCTRFSVLPLDLMCLINQACRMLISAVGFKVSLTHFSGNLAHAYLQPAHVAGMQWLTSYFRNTCNKSEKSSQPRCWKARAWLKLELEPKSHCVLVPFCASSSWWR